MKPNDKAIEAAATSLFGSHDVEKKWVEEALIAAYAAQFQSEEYAGLIEELREWDMCWPNSNIEHAVPKAADAIEALLADRNWWQNKQEETAKILGLAIDAILNRPTPVDGIRCLTPDEQDILSEVIRRAKEEKERDALAARLATVDDDALVEMMAKRMCANDGDDEEIIWGAASHTQKEYFLTQARKAYAIRPHIEAAERERCAKIA